jgi:hypothetical protein
LPSYCCTMALAKAGVWRAARTEPMCLHTQQHNNRVADTAENIQHNMVALAKLGVCRAARAEPMCLHMQQHDNNTSLDTAGSCTPMLWPWQSLECGAQHAQSPCACRHSSRTMLMAWQNPGRWPPRLQPNPSPTTTPCLCKTL